MTVVVVIEIVTWGKFYYYSHLKDKEMGAWKICMASQGDTTTKKVFGHCAIPPPGIHFPGPEDQKPANPQGLQKPEEECF